MDTPNVSGISPNAAASAAAAGRATSTSSHSTAAGGAGEGVESFLAISPKKQIIAKHLYESLHSPEYDPSSNSSYHSNNNYSRRSHSSSASRKPKQMPHLLVCYMCAQQFGTHSLHIHQQQCYVKKLLIWEKGDPATRGSKPLSPEEHNQFHGITTSASASASASSSSLPPGSVEQFNRSQYTDYSHLALLPCDCCGKKFLRDHLPIHQRNCHRQRAEWIKQQEQREQEENSLSSVNQSRQQDLVTRRSVSPDISVSPRHSEPPVGVRPSSISPSPTHDGSQLRYYRDNTSSHYRQQQKRGKLPSPSAPQYGFHDRVLSGDSPNYPVHESRTKRRGPLRQPSKSHQLPQYSSSSSYDSPTFNSIDEEQVEEYQQQQQYQNQGRQQEEYSSSYSPSSSSANRLNARRAERKEQLAREVEEQTANSNSNNKPESVLQAEQEFHQRSGDQRRKQLGETKHETATRLTKPNMSLADRAAASFLHCRYCSRTFAPDRIEKHEQVCSEQQLQQRHSSPPHLSPGNNSSSSSTSVRATSVRGGGNGSGGVTVMRSGGNRTPVKSKPALLRRSTTPPASASKTARTVPSSISGASADQDNSPSSSSASPGGGSLDRKQYIYSPSVAAASASRTRHQMNNANAVGNTSSSSSSSSSTGGFLSNLQNSNQNNNTGTAETAALKRFCEHCGTRILSSSAKFCSSCGKNL